jgi:hypothetical protein
MGDTRLSSGVGAADHAEDILGQFFVAFGQGAGQMRVRRTAIAALRNRYADPIRAAKVDWDSVAPSVLGLVAQVGRLAALIATQAGRAAICESDFTRARQTVEANVHHRSDAGVLITGPFCPPVPEETVIEGDAPGRCVDLEMPLSEDRRLASEPARTRAAVTH